MNWLHGELRKTQLPDSVVFSKLLLPQYGNYVNHQELFDKKPGPVIPAAGQLWRIRPEIYETITRKAADGNTGGLSRPFSLKSGSQIKDFSSLYFIDEPTANMLLSNAGKIVDQQVNNSNHFRDIREFIGEGKSPTEKQIKQAIHMEYRLALHRSPTLDEIARYSALHKKVSKVTGPKVAGKTMLMAILMHPEALFRYELGTGPIDELGRRRLSQREIAIALSFSLDNGLDDSFLKAAAEKKLASKDQVAAAVKKRLQSFDDNPRILQFFREYFGYPNVVNVFKDDPEKGRHDPKLLLHDVEMLVRDIVKQDHQVLRELLTTNKVYVAARLDRDTGKIIDNWDRKYPLFYQTTFNLPPDWRWTPKQPLELPKDERAGILTHPAWLAAWGGNFDNHPVQRGKWVRTHLLGGSVPDVPIGVDARIPEDEHKQLRERLARVTGKSKCWRCHKKMDPLGLPFEHYDHYGRYRRFEKKRPVQAQGKITYVGIPELEGEVSGPIELVRKLAKSEYVEQVFVRHAFRFFLGRNETLGDAATLQDAHKAYRDNDGSFKAVVVSLLSSDSFLYRRAEAKK